MSNNTASQNFHLLFGGICYATVGFPTALCNIFIAASIANFKALREQKEMILLMALATADAVNLMVFVSAGAYRIIISFCSDVLLTSRECLIFPHVSIWPFAAPFAHLMLSAVSFDRLLLVALREKYLFGMGPAYAWRVLAVLFSISSLIALFSNISVWFWGDDSAHLAAVCFVPDTHSSPQWLGEHFGRWFSYSQFVFPLLSVLIFLCIVPVYKNHQARVTPANSSLAAFHRHLKRQKKLTRSVALSCVCTFLFACLPGWLGMMMRKWEMWVGVWVSYTVTLLNPLSNCFIYHFAHRDLRTAMRYFVLRKELPTNIDLWPNLRARKPNCRYCVNCYK